MKPFGKYLANYFGKPAYIGEVRCQCDCHGFWRGYTIKVQDVFSFTVAGHYPWLLVEWGKNAKIMTGSDDSWKMYGERIDRAEGRK